MKNLWQHLSEIEKKLKTPLILLMDFDGTLSPIEQLPHEAFLPEETKRLLTKLAKKENFYVGIVSGRKLEDLKNKINLPGLIYGGNHGLEGVILEKSYLHAFDPTWPNLMQEIKERILPIISKFEGTFIEDKKISFSIHYRNIGASFIPKFQAALKPLLASYEEEELIYLTPGKMVYDVLPNTNWNKGKFVKLVTEKIAKETSQPMAIFIGDDVTDEDAFRIIPDDITIKVGNPDATAAKFFLKDTQDVLKFLKWLFSLSLSGD